MTLEETCWGYSSRLRLCWPGNEKKKAILLIILPSSWVPIAFGGINLWPGGTNSRAEAPTHCTGEPFLETGFFFFLLRWRFFFRCDMGNGVPGLVLKRKIGPQAARVMKGERRVGEQTSTCFLIFLQPFSSITLRDTGFKYCLQGSQ
jgi:hypothetical protein